MWRDGRCAVLIYRGEAGTAPGPPARREIFFAQSRRPAERHNLINSSVLSGVSECDNPVLPGITGLWQVSGRSEAGTAGMEKWDPYYVRNGSIWLDIVIIARPSSTP